MSYSKNSLTHRLIPGGSHTYSKGDDQFPANAPRYLERGDGAYVWDNQDNMFLDWTMGLRTMTLGYGHKGVIEAAIDQMWKGSNFGRPSYIETETAQDIVDLIPCADMVKFAKNGSSVTSAAVKLARAYTGRDKVAMCKDQPFFSYDDWFIGTTPCDNGIPMTERGLSLTFRYNDASTLEKLFSDNPGEIACVILEAAATAHPVEGFLQQIQALCNKNGAVFIIDEMISGFRWHLQGAQTYYGIQPDLTTFGKGIANGFSVSALAGKREIMQLGGLDHDAKRVFLISTTHGAENHGLAAARAAIKVYREEPVIEHLWKIGKALVDGLNEAARNAGISEYFKAGGVECSPTFSCSDKDGAVSLPLRTLFLQEMVRRGVLINYMVPSYAHQISDVDRTIQAASESLVVYAQALDKGYEKLLEGDSIKPVFRPYN